MNILLLIFLQFFNAFAGSFTVKSWNLLHLSDKKLYKKDKTFISKYLSQDDFDVFVVQEVLDKKVLNLLTDKQVLYSKKSGRKRYKEYIAFIVPKKYKNVKVIDYYDSHDSFERDPAMVVIGNIGVVGVHLIYGRKKARYGGLTKKEVRALKNMVKYFSKKSGLPENRIIIAGDFNLPTYKIRRVIPKEQKVLIDKGTTVSTSKKKLAAHDYDHFLIQKSISGKAFVDYKVLGKDKSAENRKRFRKRISDHYPIIFIMV